ncbi:potassium channel protein [Oceanobacillus piezotolerans]|uniref:Potassium channel protein n=1 Tax=Oceanobacillus piezotolerans TaxID=2448030 RepID=A0A498DPB0_9BACI|nr:potassium channel family protein [Oceanobacillus piezotolerans]RLL46479.1 potassium channel protein [Oceanobacillus piezotolerans]
MTVKLLKNLYFRLPILIKLLTSVLILMTAFGILIHYVEPIQFPTIFDGIWWAFVTAATVGYGDYVPLTTTGRIVAIALILSGGGIIAFYISTISAATIQREQNLEQGKIPYRGINHFIIIGWNERTRQLIEHYIEKFPALQIVLIDRTLDRVSYNEYPIHFIKGDATEDDILSMANIRMAQKVLITGDTSKLEKLADTWTILATLAIRGNNQDVFIVAEIFTKIQIENAIRAGANTIIRPNDFLSTLFFHELSHMRTATPFEDILHILKQKQFSHMKLPAELENSTFKDASLLLMSQGQLLLGYVRDGEYVIHPKKNQHLKPDDILLSLIDW